MTVFPGAEAGIHTVAKMVMLEEPTELESKEAAQEEVTRRRAEETAELVRGEHPTIAFYYLFFPLISLLVVVAAVGSGMSLMPQHDVMVEPNFWWECLAFHCNMCCFSLGAWFFTTTTPFMLNVEGIYGWKNFFGTWLFGSLICSVVWAASMAGWVYGLGLRYPAPMVGLWSTSWGLFAQMMSCCFQLPASWRAVPSFWARVQAVILLLLTNVLITLFYFGFWWLFTIVPTTFQPLLALALPFIREVFGHIISALGRRSAGGHVPSVDMIAGHIVSLFHALFISSCIGSLATEITTCILLGMDFVINLIFTGRV
jgi:hypothetical protein